MNSHMKDGITVRSFEDIKDDHFYHHTDAVNALLILFTRMEKFEGLTLTPDLIARRVIDTEAALYVASATAGEFNIIEGGAGLQDSALRQAMAEMRVQRVTH